MRKKLTSGRIPLIATLFFVLSGCSSPSKLEMAELFASQRAEMLEKVVPIEFNGYNLMRARAKSTQIVLTLLYTGNGDISPRTLAQNLQKTYCADNEIRSLLEKGVMYNLIFRDSRGRPILEHMISIDNCLKTTPPPTKNALYG